MELIPTSMKRSNGRTFITRTGGLPWPNALVEMLGAVSGVDPVDEVLYRGNNPIYDA